MTPGVFIAARSQPCQEKEPAELTVVTVEAVRGTQTKHGERPKVWVDDLLCCINWKFEKLTNKPNECAAAQCKGTLIQIAQLTPTDPTHVLFQCPSQAPSSFVSLTTRK